MQLTLGNPAEIEDECFVFDLIVNSVNATNTKCICIIRSCNQIVWDWPILLHSN